MRNANAIDATPAISLRWLLAAAATVAVVVGAPAAASASSTSATYDLTGSGSSIPGGCLDCQRPTMDASGTATCSVCIPGKPTSGNFTISTDVQTFPTDPCKVKSVSGTLDMTWSDGSTSTASVSGKFHDSKALSLAGSFYPVDPIWPTDPLTVLLNNFPPSPCLAATNPITGALDIST